MTKSNLSLAGTHYYRRFLIFLATHRNPHGCLKCADGDAMLMVLEVPALPSKQAHHGEVWVDVFLYLNVCKSLLEASVSSLQQGLRVVSFCV